MMRVVALVGQGRSLEIALGLGAAEVIALALVPPEDEAALRAAGAAGAARVVAVWDESLRETDYYGAAQTLASAVRKLGGEVVICADEVHGLLAPALADRLGAPHLSGVVAVEAREGVGIVASRPAGGRLHVLVARPPLVVGVAGMAAATAAPVPVQAQEKGRERTVERMSLSDVGIAAAELRWRRRFTPTHLSGGAPAPQPRPLRLPDAQALVDRLRAEGLLGRMASERSGL